MTFNYDRVRIAAILFALFLISGCSSVPEGERDPRDPWEGYNRAMTEFNEDFDKAIYKPIAKGYRAITPEPVDRGITNFFGNQLDLVSLLNNVLQAKFDSASDDLARVIVNTTLGLVGFIDVASELELPRHREDFGQTLGRWGVAQGPYFVWPILGPSTVRDSAGIVVGWYSTPVAYLDSSTWKWGLAILYAVDLRADLLDATDILKQAALDPYIFTRDAYLQKRLNDVYDGNPPLELDPDADPLLEEMFRPESAPAP